MRLATALVLSAALTVGLVSGHARAAEDELQYPLGPGQLQIVGGQKASSRRLVFSGRWSGDVQNMPNPVFAGATLRITGATGEGDSGLIRLPGGNWKALPKGKGYRYSDPHARAGGIKSILLRLSKGGGRVEITGGKDRLAYQVTKPQSVVTVTLISGAARWCAEFTRPKTKNTKVIGKAGTAPATCPCDTYASTWEAIQAKVLERNGCTQSGCHASDQTGGTLDLRREVAYANLVGRASAYEGLKRVEPFSPQESFLWQKLAAATSGFDLGGKGSPMPQGLPPISQDELDAIRQWILKGAPETGVVPETETLLGSCLPKPEPPADEPLDAPPAAEGVQFFAPPWEIPAKKEGENGENEVCYSTYYNLTDKVPAQFVQDCPPGTFDGPTNPTKKCFSYNHQLLRQSANSHHSIIHIYNGVNPANHPGWGYQCSGGTVPDGTACDPTLPGVTAPAGGGDCGGGYCRGKVVKAVACTFGYGPPDFEGGVQGNGSPVAPSFSGSQQPRFERVNPDGVFAILPIEGTIVWNSHAFNVYDEPIYNQQWLNIWYTANRRFPLRGIFDSTDIFVQRVKPFEEVEYCRTVLFGKGTRIADFSSHTHKRGRLFRVWGPGITQPCRSTSSDPGACLPEPTPPIMVTTEYNDPAQLIFRTPMPLDGDDAASRRFKFCSIFDNGYTDPATVKRNSTSPTALLGGKCYFPDVFNPGRVVDRGIYCVNGPKKGQECHGDDRACDSAPGANDGVCDACTLTGGVSTEDEMFILIGSYYCEPSVPGESCSGVCAAGPARGQSCEATGCPNPGACVTRPTGDVRCSSGERRGEACSSDADCPHDCLRYTNF